jgi:mono/diheme cytochrome c family protein
MKGSSVVLAIGAASASLFLAARSALPQTQSSLDSVLRGRALALRNCAMCHAVDQRTESPNHGAPSFAYLHDRVPMEVLEQELARGMLTRHPAMPKFRFTQSEVSDLIAYLASIQSRRQRPLKL